MSTSIPLTATTQLSLSGARFAQLMDADLQRATKLNVFDRVLDFFRPQSKETALRQLHTMLHDGGISVFARFNLLAQLATPDSRALFTLSVAAHPTEREHYTVEYAVNGETIKTDTISAHEKETINRHLGKPVDTALLRQQFTSIDRHRLDTQKLVARVRNEDFRVGGVNKKFHAGSGLLRADTRTGKEDFERELKLAQHAEDRPELASYISTQKKITDPGLLHADLRSPENSARHAYAVVDTYDPAHVASHEMDRCIHQLSREQASSLLPQLVDMARVLYKSEVAHRDLHMHNLVVHQVKDTGSVHLKAIDFGRMVMQEDFKARKFEDIDYLFSRQGATVAETIGRNHLARAGSEVDMKHYPIHKLCEKFNDKGIPMNALLSRIGEHLKHDLQYAGKDGKLIDAAFQKASESLQLSFAQLQRNDFTKISFA
ncbi:hypothetical protein [Comamonas antarctica]|uniref:Protein kinase domain-containing protein n=1 Tax=Comamonas antarctica TaxID=2743470 RepID=A0A6N1X105_9BURK|nr:hypothetical protein [Comamonas antarctica]QKV51435.1 hypothetical protein HUK68_00200 [Comamonas antarctica]